MHALVIGNFKELKLEFLKERLAEKDIFIQQFNKGDLFNSPKLQDLFLIDESIARQVDWPHWTGVKIILTDSKVPEERIEFMKAGAFTLWPKKITGEEIYYRLVNVRKLVVKNEYTTIELNGNIRIDIDQVHKQVFINGKEIAFTPSEYIIFSQLITHHKRVYSREDLVQLIKGAGFSTTLRTIDTHIKNIRKKTERNPQQPEIVQTVHGHGYRIN